MKSWLFHNEVGHMSQMRSAPGTLGIREQPHLDLSSPQEPLAEPWQFHVRAM